MPKPQTRPPVPREMLSSEPCPQCLDDLAAGILPHPEAVQRLPKDALAPLGLDGRKVCFDCQSTDVVMRHNGCMTWEMARIAVANDRADRFRLPGVPMGLAYYGLTRLNAPGDFDDHYAWLRRQGLLDD